MDRLVSCWIIYFMDLTQRFIRFFWIFQNAATIGLADICQYMGNSAAFIVYLAISVILCIPKKTRKYGVAMVVAYLVAFLLVNVLIKPGVG